MELNYLQKLKELQTEFASSQRKAFFTTTIKENIEVSLSFFDDFESLDIQDDDFEVTNPILEKKKLGNALLEICSNVTEINNIIYKYVNLCDKLEFPNSDLFIETKIIYPLFEELGERSIYFNILKNLEHEEYNKQLKLFRKRKDEILNFRNDIFENLQGDDEMSVITRDIVETNNELKEYMNDQTIQSFTIDYLKTYALEIKEMVKLVDIYTNNDKTDIYNNLNKIKRLFLFEILENSSNQFIYPISKIEAKIKIDNEYLNIWNFEGKYLYKNLTKNKEKNREVILNYITNNDIRLFITYKIHTVRELLNISFMEILKNGITISKCKNCNNYFIPESRTDEVYCNRISPQNPNKTCKEYGAKKTYRDEIKSIPIKYEHNKTSQYFRMKIKRAKTQKEKVLYEKQFNNYKENYQKKKQKYQSHRLEEAYFVEWIKNQKDLQQ